MSKLTQSIAILGVVAGLGVAALPLSTYAAPADVAKNAQVKTTIEESLELTLKSNNDADNESTEALQVVNLGTVDSTKIAEGTLTSTVVTNNAKGYTLTIADADADTNLVSGTDNIPTGAPVVGESHWGYKVSGINVAADATQSGIEVADYTAMPATGDATTIVNSNKSTISKTGDTATIGFGVSVSNDQHPGIYVDTVVITAAVNPAA